MRVNTINSPSSWQQQLAQAVSDIHALCRLLQLDFASLQYDAAATQGFPLRVPLSFIQRMEKSNPRDPLLLQVLPQPQELMSLPGYTRDPLQENTTNPIPGLLHKYHGRALMILAGSCAVNCRYCFRRHFPYEENIPDFRWQRAMEYIESDTTLDEIILSGGEPLLVKDNQLQQLIERLSQIPHLQRVRIHTRLPVVIPDRVTDELIRALTKTRLQVVMVLHINHANEIDAALQTAVEKFLDAKITVFNQAVLLKEINDDADVLVQLSKKLFSVGIIPYYLHVLDAVAGAQHFDIPESRARELFLQLQARLPGYLVPKLVREVAGEVSKVSLFT